MSLQHRPNVHGTVVGWSAAVVYCDARAAVLECLANQDKREHSCVPEQRYLQQPKSIRQRRSQCPTCRLLFLVRSLQHPVRMKDFLQPDALITWSGIVSADGWDG